MKFVLDDLIALADFYCAGLNEFDDLFTTTLVKERNCDPRFGIASFCRQVAPARHFSLNDPDYLSALKKSISTLERVLESENKNNI